MEDDLRFNVAEGFALLGMRREAMQALKVVPLSPRNREVSELLLELMAATAKAWAAGEELARLAKRGDAIEHREGVGRFWLGRAMSLCAGGDIHAARQAVSQMVQICPEGRQEAVGSNELAGIW